MDSLNRGTSFHRNGRLHIDLWDEYEHFDNCIEYVVENILQTTDTKSVEYLALYEQFNLFGGQKCECTNESGACSHANCSHGANYVVHIDTISNCKELILNENRKSHDIIYECSQFCACPQYCNNRLVQFGPRKDLKIQDYSHVGKQFGLATLKSIPKGSFICEYAGEILCKKEAQRRHQLNDDNQQMNYIICLNERSLDHQNTIQTFIDPSRIGNIGRYLNHSCDPNCEIISVRVDGINPKLGKNILFTSNSDNSRE